MTNKLNLFITFILTIINTIFTFILTIINIIFTYIKNFYLNSLDRFSTFVKQDFILGENGMDMLEQLFLSCTLLFFFYFVCWLCILFFWLSNFFWRKYIKKHIILNFLGFRLYYLNFLKKNDFVEWLFKDHEKNMSTRVFVFLIIIYNLFRFILFIFLVALDVLIYTFFGFTGVFVVPIFLWISKVWRRYPISMLLLLFSIYFSLFQYIMWVLAFVNICVGSLNFPSFVFDYIMLCDIYITRVSCFWWLLFDHNLNWFWCMFLIFI